MNPINWLPLECDGPPLTTFGTDGCHGDVEQVDIPRNRPGPCTVGACS
jgi:hypothetical protein